MIVDRTNRTRRHRERWLRIAREADVPAVAVEMNVPASLCRLRNCQREKGRRLSEDRMERMLAALEPVQPDEGFRAIYSAEVTLPEILSQVLAERKELPHEHCHQTR